VNISSLYSEIKQLLSIPDENFDLENNPKYFLNTLPDENKLEVIGDILNFVNKFSMFQDIKPFIHSLYSCITKTLEIKPDSVYDFEELLAKNAIMQFVQEHINYSKLTQKDQIYNFLTDSLEKLDIQPLITNLGILIKPIYQDQKYIASLNSLKEFEVNYSLINGSKIQIKSEIDNWLKSQEFDLDSQEELQARLLMELDRLLLQHNLSKSSEKYEKLHKEVIEMLNMKLTMLSLMDHISDDSIEPIPIR
jgi:hypothetical protein